MSINIPGDVPQNKQALYKKNLASILNKKGRLFLLAGDQKIEHQNKDFFGPGINPEDNNPEHLFQIASTLKNGVFASQLGLISRYGKNYPKINYLVKLNSKSDLTTGDPLSLNLHEVSQVLEFQKNSKLKIKGIGLTLYLGGEHEAQLLRQAAQSIYQAHQNGLITVLWVYPRGGKVKNDEDINLLAGAAGTALCLGADFVKIKYPYDQNKETAKKFRQATKAAGNCGVLCAGGEKQKDTDLLKHLEWQITISETKGVALGRNIHQRSFKEAKELVRKIEKVLE